MFNLLIYFFGMCCSEQKQSFILYQEFRLCYYRTVNLHTDKTQLGQMKYKESFSLHYVKDTIRILSVLHGSTSTLSEASFFFFFFRQAGRHPGEDEEYFSVTGKYRPHCYLGSF